MKVTIKGKNSSVTDDLIKYAERKIGKLEKYSNRIQAAAVSFLDGASKKRNKAFRVEIALNSPGQTLRSVEEKESFKNALDSALEKLEEQLRRVKTKRIDKVRDRAVEEELVPREVEAVEESVAGPVIFVERFPVKPLSTAEAIATLELSTRDFLLFVTENSAVNCVYRRRDGGYGLLVPEDDLTY